MISKKPEVQGVPLLDLARENGPLLDELQAALRDVLHSGQFILGNRCEQLEQSMANLCGVKHAIGCASGSDALLLALMALDIGPGDEVILPSFTFFATASAVWRLGAKPVFADIDHQTFNLDPADVERRITPATRAMIPVHLFGQCADMDSLRAIAQSCGLAIIEDAAQAIGATYGDQGAGSMGAIGCFSFYPTKNLGGCGDGGMLTTGDDGLADRLRLLRGHGMRPRYHHREVGINSRLDEFQAAVLLVKLAHLSDWTEQRRMHAERYLKVLRGAELNQELILPAVDSRAGHVWNQFTLRARGVPRDALRQHLRESCGIGTEIYYPIPLHQQPCFASLGYRPGSLPHTELASREVISVPIFPGLTTVEQDRILDALLRYCQSPAAIRAAA